MCWNILVYTITLQYIQVHTGMYWYVWASTRKYWNHPKIVYSSTCWNGQVCTIMYWSVMIFGLYSAGTCHRLYLDNLWLCWVRVWAVLGCNARQMLPLQASKQVLSWCEPTGIHVHTVTYKYVPVHTGTYYYVLVCISTHWYLLVFTFLFRCWGAGVCAGHNCSDPTYPYRIADDIDHVPCADCMHAPSYSSSATWVQLADCPLRTHHTPGWSGCGRDCSQVENSENWLNQAFCGDS